MNNFSRSATIELKRCCLAASVGVFLVKRCETLLLLLGRIQDEVLATYEILDRVGLELSRT